jgi:hypothetical protein
MYSQVNGSMLGMIHDPEHFLTFDLVLSSICTFCLQVISCWKIIDGKQDSSILPAYKEGKERKVLICSTRPVELEKTDETM